MSNISRKFSDFFGLTPAQDDADFGDRYERDSYEDDYRPAGRYSDDYEDEYRASDRGYSRGAGIRDYDRDDRADRDQDRDDSYSRPHLRPLDRPVAPSVHHITPKTEFLDKFSEAKVIGESFRDGDIVVFDLVDLEPAERKRYLDFVAGLAFALRGRIQRTEGGAVFTLLPEGVELSDVERDRLSV